MSLIAVVDYGMGNLRSVSQALLQVASPVTRIKVSSDPQVVAAADKVVVPGQGAARDCMQKIKQHELEEVIQEALTSKPFLGICMGLQVLMQRSDENNGTDCLGIYAGKVRKFGQSDLKVPQMGWNKVYQQRPHFLFRDINDGAHFYFANSYYVAPDDQEVVLANTHYGIDFTSALGKDNVFACQFHPEKSGRDGLQLMQNFLAWDGES